MVTRVLPPVTGNTSVRANGRLYVGVVGITQDVNDWDAQILIANGFLSLGMVGTTAQRPTNPPPGTVWNDLTTGFAVVFDGKQYRHHQTGSVS
jgi:thiamine phosphate synthase YjbQ (UPF0047 family)